MQFIFESGLAANFTAKNIKTVLANNAKRYFVVLPVILCASSCFKD